MYYHKIKFSLNILNQSIRRPLLFTLHPNILTKGFEIETLSKSEQIKNRKK